MCLNHVDGFLLNRIRKISNFTFLYKLFFRYDKYDNRSVLLQRNLVYLHFHVATIILWTPHYWQNQLFYLFISFNVSTILKKMFVYRFREWLVETIRSLCLSCHFQQGPNLQCRYSKYIEKLQKRVKKKGKKEETKIVVTPHLQ